MSRQSQTWLRLSPLRVTGLAAIVVAVGSLATWAVCPGCIDRSRINNGCEWTGDLGFPLDQGTSAHRAHLVADAHVAEELAIRFADVEHGRRHGIEHHGGLLDGGRVRNDCLSQMFGAIERSHGVTAAEVQVARAGRNATYDAAVAVLFLPMYALVSLVVTRRVGQRFPRDEPLARWVAVCLASVPVSLLGLQGFRLWGAVWEVIRVGNGHMTSIRAASRSAWVHHMDGQMFWGMLLFIAIALCWNCTIMPAHGRTPSPEGQVL